MRWLVLLLLAGCFLPTARRVGADLWPVVCTVPNNTAVPVVAVAQDGDGRVRVFGDTLAPGSDKRCELWPWKHPFGRIGYVVGRDTTWMAWQRVPPL